MDSTQSCTLMRYVILNKLLLHVPATLPLATERDKERQRVTEKDRKTERQRDRETKRKRDRETER